MRNGKESNILSVANKLLLEENNWMQVESKSSYQFPGIFKTSLQQQLYFTSDVPQLVQSCKHLHFIWKDSQLSKGPLNKDHLIGVEIQGKKVSLHYRSSPCAGVKVYPIS